MSARCKLCDDREVIRVFVAFDRFTRSVVVLERGYEVRCVCSGGPR